VIAHTFPFDPTCGWSEADLLAAGPPETAPGDFADFWRATYEETLALDTEAACEPLWSPEPGMRLFALRYRGWRGLPMGSFLAVPEQPRGILVVGHGYGGGWQPVIGNGFITIAPSSPGFGLSLTPEIPWRVGSHVLHRIGSRDDYVLRAAVSAVWHAASVACARHPAFAGRLFYKGGSYGGGIGALALPWDARFRAGRLDVPTFGHHPLRLRYPSNGSGEAVRAYAASHPGVGEVLRYYDAATAATFIDKPVVVLPALFDPTVVPPGQFAVANAVPERWRTRLILPAGHYSVPENTPVYEAAERAWESLVAEG